MGKKREPSARGEGREGHGLYCVGGQKSEGWPVLDQVVIDAAFSELPRRRWNDDVVRPIERRARPKKFQPDDDSPIPLLG
jgi:hypothetical protein